MYVKLFGGPLDGQQENVIDGCDKLRLRDRSGLYHIYERSKSDRARFVYQDTEE
jgi:hypothetical protein